MAIAATRSIASRVARLVCDGVITGTPLNAITHVLDDGALVGADHLGKPIEQPIEQGLQVGWLHEPEWAGEAAHVAEQHGHVARLGLHAVPHGQWSTSARLFFDIDDEDTGVMGARQAGPQTCLLKNIIEAINEFKGQHVNRMEQRKSQGEQRDANAGHAPPNPPYGYE